MIAQLKKLAELLDVQVEGKKDKNGYAKALITFGLKPAKSNVPSIKEVKAAEKEKKAKAAARKKAAAEKRKAAAGKKSAGNAKKRKASSGKKRAPARKKKLSAAELATVKAARGSRYFHAQAVKVEVKEGNPDASKPELLKIIKEQYNGLTDAAKETFQTLADKDQTRYDDALEALEEESKSEEESESEEDEEEDDDDDGSEYEEEDDDEPPNKKKRAEPEEESSDEEPLEPGTFPTDKQITKCVRKIVRTADLEVMTKKTVRADAAKILGVNLDEKKALIKEVITETIDAMN